MIPILYDKGETAFISNGLGRLRDCISAVVCEERNNIYELNFEYPIDGVNYDRIQLGRIVAVEHDESGDVQPFDIISYSRPINGVVTFHCVHISYRQTAMAVSGTNINSLADAFTMLGSAEPTNPFNYWTDKDSVGFLASADGVPHSVRQVLGGMEGSILDAYGGEYEWDKWTVKLWSSRGTLKNFTIRYGVNLTEYEEEVDYSDTYNAVIPFWKGQDGNGEVVVKGDKVSVSYPSFNGQERCIPLDLSDKFETKPTKAQVESEGLSYINANQTYLPAQSIKVDFVRISDTPEYEQFKSLQTCKLCDSINVVFPRYGMSGLFKIVKTEYDVLQERYNTLELGTLSTSLAEALGISQESSSKLTTGPADYIVDQNSTTRWTYRKWKSGIVECWGEYTASIAVNTSSTSYGGYRSGQLNIPAFPVTYNNAPVIFASIGSGSQGAWVNNVTPSTTGGTFYLSCGSSLSATDRTIYFYAKGV